MLRFVVALFAMLFLWGCAVPVDTVVKIKGEVVDEHGERYKQCGYQVSDDGDIVHAFNADGEFSESFTAARFKVNEARLIVVCDGLVKSVPLAALPEQSTDVIDVGTVVLP